MHMSATHCSTSHSTTLTPHSSHGANQCSCSLWKTPHIGSTMSAVLSARCVAGRQQHSWPFNSLCTLPGAAAGVTHVSKHALQRHQPAMLGPHKNLHSLATTAHDHPHTAAKTCRCEPSCPQDHGWVKPALLHLIDGSQPKSTFGPLKMSKAAATAPHNCCI